jgi:GT2 family glycosyltransferase
MTAQNAANRVAQQITVVLLTYNCGPRLDHVLQHLSELRLPVIAVDNASTDNTVEVLGRYDVEVVRLPQNIGAAARNAGVDRAATPYVAFCDDDSWYEREGLLHALEVFELHPALALIHARVLVEPDGALDPMCIEMARSPLLERHGIPGAVLLGFMAGFVIVRRKAYREVGGYDPRFFIGGEEETLAVKFARRGWQMRYLPEVIAHHLPSMANAPHLHAYRMRNTVWNCWLHRRFRSAVRHTVCTVADSPKNSDFARAVVMTVAGLAWVLRGRDPVCIELDTQYRLLEVHGRNQ